MEVNKIQLLLINDGKETIKTFEIDEDQNISICVIDDSHGEDDDNLNEVTLNKEDAKFLVKFIKLHIGEK
jgi:hypothetical protein